MLDLTIQTKALENGIYVLDKENCEIKHKSVFTIGKDFVEVFVSGGMGCWDDDYDSSYNESYDLKTYGQDWALTKEELEHCLQPKANFSYKQKVILKNYCHLSDYDILQLTYEEGSKLIGDRIAEAKKEARAKRDMDYDCDMDYGFEYY